MKTESKHTAIIIDDEPNALVVLRKLLDIHCPQVEVLASVLNSIEGLEKIKALKPDIVFLDIEMPQMNGFQLLSSLDEINFHLIFTTAYDQFAVKAFKFNALDYLLKPIDPVELKSAVKKINEKSAFLPQQLEQISEMLHESEKGHVPGRIAFPHTKGYRFISLSDIIYCESESNYTVLHLVNEPKFTVCRTLGEIEDILITSHFLRIHRSYLVNTKKIKEFIKGEGGYLIMENEIEIPVSRNKREQLGSILKPN
ncbi:MAG: response regulator transcription factor [Chitinophagaceae bacterium]|nr:response regulator transcription factor [Chitinophagaceae bacterium]